jgi:hypothetical protein
MRLCSLPSCSKPHRARGLCSTHYNDAYQPDRHAARPTACTICATVIVRPARSDRRPTCSPVCRAILQFGSPGWGGYDWAIDAADRARKAGAVVVEIFTREQVFVRDRLVCYLCTEPVDLSLPQFDPGSATVDHVVPLSRGGQHALANARLGSPAMQLEQAGPHRRLTRRSGVGDDPYVRFPEYRRGGLSAPVRVWALGSCTGLGAARPPCLSRKVTGC